jgi:hypothetical protein
MHYPLVWAGEMIGGCCEVLVLENKTITIQSSKLKE